MALAALLISIVSAIFSIGIFYTARQSLNRSSDFRTMKGRTELLSRIVRAKNKREEISRIVSDLEQIESASSGSVVPNLGEFKARSKSLKGNVDEIYQELSEIEEDDDENKVQALIPEAENLEGTIDGALEAVRKQKQRSQLKLIASN